MIQYFKHHQINKAKWDDCIQKSINGLIYAQAWYLDIVSPNWDALIEGDYECIMPLTYKRKFLLPCLIQPSFAQQLGLFSSKTITSENVIKFIERIPAKFLVKDFNINSRNLVSNYPGFSNRINYELNLERDYADIYSGYNENTRRNIKKASTVCIENYNQIEDFVHLFSLHAKKRIAIFIVKQLEKLGNYALDKQVGEIVIARDADGTIIAGVFFLKTLGRIIYLASFTTLEGNSHSPMFLIIDEVVKKHANQPWVLDFEGSMIPGIARFFAGFGAEKKGYQRYRKIL